jgi:uncharacterized protein DUF6064
MSEWWTYRLTDFLLFSPKTYDRLFELYNAAIWPAQIVALALGFTIWILLSRATVSSGRFIAAALAASWLWVGIVFQMHRYATINWAAAYFGWAFVLETALILWLGVIRGRLTFAQPSDRVGWLGLGIFLFALWAQPLTSLLLGRSLRRLEIFGVAPDPTVIATLGLLMLASGPGRRTLVFIPVIWCLISGATLWAIRASDAWIPPLAAAFAGGCLGGDLRLRRRPSNAEEETERRVAEVAP